MDYYECGICSAHHPWEFDGDCREDASRVSDPPGDAAVFSWEDRLAADVDERASEYADRECGEMMKAARILDRDALDREGYTLLASIDNFLSLAAKLELAVSPVTRETLEALRTAAQAVEDDLFYDPAREERQA